MNRKDEDQKKTSRRDFLKKASTAAIVSPVLATACSDIGGISAMSPETKLFDEALKAMAHIAPRGNHGPMAAEAIVTLGRSDVLPAFTRNFLGEFSASYPSKKKKITNESWKDALGQSDRISDWIEFFEKELNSNPWKKVIDDWIDVFVPGICASAAHGLIRTAHAVRSLNGLENDVRKKELAQALGYWAAHFQTLPESKDGKNLGLNLSEAVKKIPPIPLESKKNRGNIVVQLRNLDYFPDFADVINYVEIKGDPARVLTALTELFAKVYLEKVHNRNHIILIHIITGLASVRTLVPLLSKNNTAKILRYGWQAAAALSSISGEPRNDLPDLDVVKIDSKKLVEKAVDSYEVHAIKFTEACLREYKLNPKPVYLAAAKDAVERLA